MIKPQQAVILLSRGGYSQAPQEQLNNLVISLKSARPDIVVVGAVVEKGAPSLPEALQQCAETGVSHIIVQPIFLPADHNLQRWLAKVIMRWYSQWPGEVIEICLADSLGNHPALHTAVVEAIQDSRPFMRNVPATPPDDWETDPAGWSNIPPHSYHVFFCQGPRCTALGADNLAAHLRKQLKMHNLDHDSRVLVAQTGCLYPCNLGPVMVVYPDGVWYGNLTPEAIEQIVEQHFVGGQRVEQYVCRVSTET
jgi:(2Fe-2S) ferredoxin